MSKGASFQRVKVTNNMTNKNSFVSSILYYSRLWSRGTWMGGGTVTLLRALIHSNNHWCHMLSHNDFSDDDDSGGGVVVVLSASIIPVTLTSHRISSAVSALRHSGAR